MKQVVLAVVLLLSAAQQSSAQQLKLGHIDRQKVLMSLPERKDAEARMQTFAKSLDERLKAMGLEYETMVAKAQASADSMTQTQKDMAVREIQELEQRIKAAQEKAQEDLSKQEEELLAPMVERVSKAISDVGAAGNYTYIFDISTGLVLYFDKGEDLM
ncbi:MAG TPA: OmpH family outer membrane protein, partial [Flavobacteriales bacterium]|nr:OmpH family outer membrane protein [Flavobacteriales bacterium]